MTITLTAGTGLLPSAIIVTFASEISPKVSVTVSVTRVEPDENVFDVSAELVAKLQEYCEIPIGDEEESPLKLTCSPSATTWIPSISVVSLVTVIEAEGAGFSLIILSPILGIVD